MSTVRTRFAPSPTGPLHLGGVRTALYSWLHAKCAGGEFVLRLEDTDRRRCTPAYDKDIVDSLMWLGLEPDLGPYRQSTRASQYHDAIQTLLAAGSAYRCYCSLETLATMRKTALEKGLKPRYDGRCRDRTKPPSATAASVVRLRTPLGGEVVIEDRLQGKVTYKNEELDDLVLLRSDGTPTYHLTVVVDDIDMGITEVIRGDDHLNNTPRQLNLYAALQIQPPHYTHLPLILGVDGARLSKRHGAEGVSEFRRRGYLPEALLNYAARLGWSVGDRELYTPQELIAHFDLAHLNRSAARFDPQKLSWYNQQHLMRMPIAEIAERLAPYLGKHAYTPEPTRLLQLVDALRERESTLDGLADRIGVYLQGPAGYAPKDAHKWLGSDAVPVLRSLRANLAQATEWQAVPLLSILNDYRAKSGLSMGRIAQPLRVALCGVSASPPIDLTLELVGREATLERLQQALDYADISRETPGLD